MSLNACFKQPESQYHNEIHTHPIPFQIRQKNVTHINSSLAFCVYLIMATLSRLEPNKSVTAKTIRRSSSYGCLDHALQGIELYARPSPGTSSIVYLFRPRSQPMTSILIRRSRESTQWIKLPAHNIYASAHWSDVCGCGWRVLDEKPCDSLKTSTRQGVMSECREAPQYFGYLICPHSHIVCEGIELGTVDHAARG